VFDLAEPANISGDWNVVGGISEDHVGRFVTHESDKGGFLKRTAAKELVFAQDPQIALLRHRRRSSIGGN